MDNPEFDASDSLGFVTMPEGYRLMLNYDRTHFYWLRVRDGMESCIHWNKWAVYRGAKKNAERHADKS